MDLCKLTEEVWHTYILGGEQSNFRLLKMLDPHCVIIGTGRHEFYTNVEAFATALAAEVEERQPIQFQFKNFWCEQKEITPDVQLVYGGLYIWWESEDKSVQIDMDSRFTMLYKQEGEDWRLVHIHQSLPNPEQEAGEYYPKTLLEQVEKTQEKVRFLQNLAQKDSLTGLLNFRTLQDQYQAWGQDGAWLFVIDIDDFKCINDTLGHLEGNRVLQAFAGILSSTVRADDVVSRMGGDEFVVLCRGLCGEENARELLQRLFARVAALRDSVTSWAGISAGATPIRHGEALETAFKRADHALYDAKRNGKNRFSIF